jgi:Zn-dependent protease with chaperone function
MSFNSELYAHDLDCRALEALSAFPKIVRLREYYVSNVDEKKERMLYLSSAVRLGENQMPEVYHLLLPVCEKLGIGVPELFYIKSKQINAWTFGSINPYICVTSELVEKLTQSEIASVLAHECGHIACKHSLYHSLAWLLADGVNDAVIAFLPGIRRFVTPALVRSLLFWKRCSELSADRAAVLCDGNAEGTVRALLRVHGYGDEINAKAFIEQAIDFRSFVDESAANKALEQMMIADEDHPRLATRAYECYEWANSDLYRGILDGTYTVAEQLKEKHDIQTDEIVAAEMSLSTEHMTNGTAAVSGEQIDLEIALSKVNQELERYTSHADKADYAFAIASGLCAGIVDSVFVGEFSLENAHEWGSEKTESFVVKIAKTQGYEGDDVKGAILFLAEKKEHSDGSIKQGFHLAADSNTPDFGGGTQHHLRDFAHHASITGLLFSMLTQFTEKSYGTDTTGRFIVVDVRSKEFIGKDIPQKFLFGTVFWFFHLVSDVAGSGDLLSEGTGIPGPLLSAAKLLASTPLFKDMVNEAGNREISVFISKLFNGTLLGHRYENGKLIPLRFDFRTELGILHELGRQSIPVILNEVLVRAFYFLRRLVNEIVEKKVSSISDLGLIDWNTVKPAGKRTIDRMLTVSTMTFTIADTADAAIRAAVESGGNWVLFSGKFVTRFNYIGAGRAAIAVVKEISNERKEAQLIHEKMILMEAKTAAIVQQLEAYKGALEERVSGYLAEDIEAFMAGFDYMKMGLSENDPNLVIKGNVVIQRVLGREPQFTNQEEFDELMDSDIPLIL